MKLVISSYCLDREIEQGRMTLAEAIDWARRTGRSAWNWCPSPSALMIQRREKSIRRPSRR